MDDDDDDALPIYPPGVLPMDPPWDCGVVRVARSPKGVPLRVYYSAVVFLLVEEASGRIVGAHTALGVEYGAAIGTPTGEIVLPGLDGPGETRLFENDSAFIEWMKASTH